MTFRIVEETYGCGKKKYYVEKRGSFLFLKFWYRPDDKFGLNPFHAYNLKGAEDIIQREIELLELGKRRKQSKKLVSVKTLDMIYECKDE